MAVLTIYTEDFTTPDILTCMEQDPTGKRDDALAFLVDNETGVLATVSPEGTPRARLVYYTADDNFNVYFLTLANTRKVADIGANPHVAFTVSNTETPRTLQLEGTVTDLTETATNDPLLVSFVKMLSSKSTYGIPIERLDTATMRFFKITPQWVRWGDFTFGEGTDTVLTKIETKQPEGD